MNAAHTFPPYVPKIHSIIILYNLRMRLPSGLFPLGFPIKILYEFLTSPVRATCSAHLIPLDLIILITFCEAYMI